MKKRKWIIILLSASLLLIAGCNQKENNSNIGSDEREDTEVEKENGIFKDSDKIEDGQLRERSETQFDDIIDYTLDKNDIKEVKKALSSAKLTENTVKYDQETYKYTLYLFDENEDILYWIFVDSEGKFVYEETELKAPELEEWLAKIEKEQK